MKPTNETLRRDERAKISAKRSEIAAICQRYGAQKLAVFGSLTHPGEFGEASDVDFLVQFAPGVQHGFSFFAMEEELEALLERRVELLTMGWLSEHFRDEVAAQAETVWSNIKMF